MPPIPHKTFALEIRFLHEFGKGFNIQAIAM
jgi:hypothetical protein